MEYNATVIVLGYILSPDKTKALMLYHNASPSDLSYGKYNGYSDELRSTESTYETFQRCVLEQTGLTVRKARFRGSIHWPNFRDRRKSFFGQIFVCDEYEGIPKEFNTHGNNRWVTISEMMRGDVPIWDGDKHFLPLVFDKEAAPFHGYMPYERGVPRDWFVQRH